jgi:hypothetical protein
MEASKNFINEAVELKKALTEERAVYQFDWVDEKERLGTKSVHAIEGESGLVGMCLFPGLMRKVKEGDGQLVINVVKAIAKSMSALN